MILLGFSLYYVVLDVTMPPIEELLGIPDEADRAMPESFWYIRPMFVAMVYGAGAAFFDIISFVLLYDRKK